MRRILLFVGVLATAVSISGCRYAGAITDASGSRGIRWEHSLETDVHLAYDPPTTAPAEPEDGVE